MSTEQLTSETEILTLTARVRRGSVCDKSEKIKKQFKSRDKYS